MDTVSTNVHNAKDVAWAQALRSTTQALKNKHILMFGRLFITLTVFSLRHLTKVTLTGTIHAQHVYLDIDIQDACKHVVSRYMGSIIILYQSVSLRLPWDIKKTNRLESTRMSSGFSDPS